MLVELPDQRVQEVINADLTRSLCDWARLRQRESDSLGLDLAGFGLEPGIYHLDQYLVSVELRTTTISEMQAHPAEDVLTFNYSLADGGRIELSDLFLPYDVALGGVIAGRAGSPGYAAQAEDSGYDAFLVDDRGIEFVFPPCRLEACAAGYISVFVPYADLAGLIDPDGAAGPYL